MPNPLIEFAKTRSRNYIMPEDIGDLIDSGVSPADLVFPFLQILGKQIPCGGIEDTGLCAFVLWERHTNGT